jgi:hypothetical protein
MTNRRSIFAVLGTSLVAAVALWRKRAAAPAFVEHTPPGDRYRTIALGDRELHVREDLLRSGFYRDLRFHDDRSEAKR